MKKSRSGSQGRTPRKGDAAKRSNKKAPHAPRNQQGARPHRKSLTSKQEHGSRPPAKPRDPARWVVGLHSCEETLKVRPKAVREVWFREDYEGSIALRTLAETAQSLKLTINTKTNGQLDHVGAGHQGVALAVLESPDVDWDDLKAEGQRLVVVLDGIEDPHNLGSMLRTSWLTGVSAIFIPEDRSVGLTPAVCKVASGGAEHVPVERHTSLPQLLKSLKDAGFWVYGLAEGGTRKPWEFNLPEKVAWVIGSEGSGIRITTERACDELARIPQVQTGSSYNAAVALAMALSETCRQFGKPE